MSLGLPGLTALGLAAGAVVGAAAGIGGYTFWYARGGSYLTDRPEACANCHVMQQHYDGWRKSSHHAVAVCNDCHTPHAFPDKYLVKGLNGYHHSFAFTSGQFVEPLRITPFNRQVTEDQCRHCHADIAALIDGPRKPGEARLSCVRCHDSVGHLH